MGNDLNGACRQEDDPVAGGMEKMQQAAPSASEQLQAAACSWPGSAEEVQGSRPNDTQAAEAAGLESDNPWEMDGPSSCGGASAAQPPEQASSSTACSHSQTKRLRVGQLSKFEADRHAQAKQLHKTRITRPKVQGCKHDCFMCRHLQLAGSMRHGTVCMHCAVPDCICCHNTAAPFLCTCQRVHAAFRFSQQVAHPLC